MVDNANLNRRTSKIFRIYLKVIPTIIGILYFINAILSYLGCNIKIINYLVFYLLIGFLYLASYLLKFCEYHRMFLHLAVVIHIINLYDYYIGIPVSDFDIMILYSIITLIFMFIAIYLKLKNV